jgi:hypothetical protein
MIYIVLLLISIIGGIVYVVIVMMEVPGMADERLGVFEPLPENLNQWVIDCESDAGKAALERGQQRETRLFADPAGGFLGRERLLRQARYRNLRTDEIDSVEPDQPYRRKRVRK